ncbi:MAG: hypothetical protein ACREP9_15975, partial [Candidatus Dormibacteraceae bacterium]
MTGKERPLEYDKILNIKDLPWNPVKDQQVAGLGAVPSKQEGQAFVLDAPILEGNLSVAVQEFGLAVEFTYPAWEDEQYGVFRDMAKEMARSGRYREEVTGWNLFNTATATPPAGSAFDGLSLLNTSHTAAGNPGVLYSNTPAVNVGFSITGIQGAIIRFHNMLNDRGLPQIMFPKKFIISPTNLFAAREILGSTNKPFTADNEINSLQPEEFTYMVSHYLTNATNWFLCADQGEHDMNFGWRTHVILDSFDD